MCWNFEGLFGYIVTFGMYIFDHFVCAISLSVVHNCAKNTRVQSTRNACEYGSLS